MSEAAVRRAVAVVQPTAAQVVARAVRAVESLDELACELEFRGSQKEDGR